MVQWAYDGWISFGIHIDFRRRKRGDGFTYGPYVDIHFLFWILSLGNNPVYAGEIELVTSVAIARERGSR